MLLSAGEDAGRAFEAILQAGHGLEHHLDIIPDDLPGFNGICPQKQVFFHCHGGEYIFALGNVSDSFADDRLRTNAHKGFSFKGDFAACHFEHSCNSLERCAFAAAVAAENRGDRTAPDLQRHPVENLQLPIAGGDIVHMQHNILRHITFLLHPAYRDTPQ